MCATGIKLAKTGTSIIFSPSHLIWKDYILYIHAWLLNIINKLIIINLLLSDKIVDVLRYFETLHADDILHGFHKRDVSKQEKIVSFTTLNR